MLVKNDLATSCVIIGIIFFSGFYVGRLLASDNKTTNYKCDQIARFHADLLTRDYQIDPGFNPDPDNPKRAANQKAAELNGKLLEICHTDPRK